MQHGSLRSSQPVSVSLHHKATSGQADVILCHFHARCREASSSSKTRLLHYRDTEPELRSPLLSRALSLPTQALASLKCLLDHAVRHLDSKANRSSREKRVLSQALPKACICMLICLSLQLLMHPCYIKLLVFSTKDAFLQKLHPVVFMQCPQFLLELVQDLIFLFSKLISKATEEQVKQNFYKSQRMVSLTTQCSPSLCSAKHTTVTFRRDPVLNL